MFFLKRLLPVILIGLALFGGGPAYAQGCGQQNPNCIVPTAPVGTNNNQAASTAFVQQNISPIFITCPTHQWINKFAAGLSVCLQPAFSDISGTAQVAQGGTGQTSFTANLPILGNGTGSLIQGTLSGNTTELATVAGALTTGHGVVVDSHGNLVDAGTGGNVSGSGSGTVGDLSSMANTTNTAITSAGYNATQIPGLIPTTATVTISIASPAVVTWTAHGLTANAPVYLCTSGALPTGLTPCVPASAGSIPNSYQANPTLYYVVGSSITANTFQLATSIANAKAGTAINTSGTQSGTHTAFANSAACTGCIGEHIYIIVPFSGAGSVACSNGSPDTLVASLTLQPGIWEMSGATGVFGSATAVFNTNHSSYGIGISGIQSTPFGGTTDLHVTSNNSNGWLFPLNKSIIVIYAANTAVNFYSEPVWTGSGATATCFGDFHAVRVH